jgi:hypothetical protein
MNSRRGSILIVVILVVAIVAVVGVYLLEKQGITIFPQSQPSLTPLPAEVPAKEGDMIANWKTYTNTKYKFSFKYPQNYNFEEQYVEIGVLAWGANITDPNYKEDKNTKVTDMQGIGAAVRRKNNLSFQEWINNECPDNYNILDIQISSKPAKRFNCLFGNDNDNGYLIVAIDNGSYIYTLTDQGYKLNPVQEKYFDQILSTFQFLK